MKGADRGCSKCLSAVLSHTVFRKINTTNLGEEITLNEIIKTLYSKKKKKTTLEEYLVYSKWDSHFEKLWFAEKPTLKSHRWNLTGIH